MMLHQVNNRPKRIAVFASGAALALCLGAVAAVRFQQYDPSVPAENETFPDYALLAGVWLVPFASVYFPHTPPEGSYCTEAELCLQFAMFVAILTGVINVFDSFVELLLCKLGSGSIRFAARLPLMALLSVLMLGIISVMVLML